MEWGTIVVAIIGSGAFSAFITWLSTRSKTQIEEQGLKVENVVKVTNLANNLFDELLQVKRELGELKDELRQERAIRLDCQNRLTELERKVNG